MFAQKSNGPINLKGSIQTIDTDKVQFPLMKSVQKSLNNDSKVLSLTCLMMIIVNDGHLDTFKPWMVHLQESICFWRFLLQRKNAVRKCSIELAAENIFQPNNNNKLFRPHGKHKWTNVLYRIQYNMFTRFLASNSNSSFKRHSSSPGYIMAISE